MNRAVEQLLQLAMRDSADDGRPKADEVRIRRRDQQRMQARHVAGNVEGEDLAAVADDAGLVEEAADHEDTARSRLALAQHDLAVGDLAQRGGQGGDLPALLVGQCFDGLETCDELRVRHESGVRASALPQR